VNEAYHILSKKNSSELAKLVAQNGQMLMPMVELIEQSQIAVDDLLEDLGRATLEAVLLISAANVAGENHQGRMGGSVLRHGSQAGIVSLSNRKVRVQKPRLRERGGGKGKEVAVAAYEAMQADDRLGANILRVMMRGVSTRNYREILPEACECIGVSKSSVSRHFALASEEECRKLLERRFDDTDLLVIYIDGMVFADHCVIASVGVDRTGAKHVLGVMEGATENTTVVKGLLESMVERGIKPDRKRLFVIDGAKALRAGIDAVYGQNNPVQRCRKHKERNVAGYLPTDMGEYAVATMRAAWKLPADEGTVRLKTFAESISKQYPGAAASVLEGLDEMFTVNRLGLPKSLCRGLITTNIIESSISGVKGRTHRVKNWQDGSMVKRWAASSLLETEKRYRKIMGFRDLWMLDAALKEEVDNSEKAA